LGLWVGMVVVSASPRVLSARDEEVGVGGLEPPTMAPTKGLRDPALTWLWSSECDKTVEQAMVLLREEESCLIKAGWGASTDDLANVSWRVRLLEELSRSESRCVSVATVRTLSSASQLNVQFDRLLSFILSKKT
jgi:hypothetical protein